MEKQSFRLTGSSHPASFALIAGSNGPAHIATEQDEQIKEFIRMRDDHELALKKVKQQILAFYLRYAYVYSGAKSHWTNAHIA